MRALLAADRSINCFVRQLIATDFRHAIHCNAEKRVIRRISASI